MAQVKTVPADSHSMSPAGAQVRPCTSRLLQFDCSLSPPINQTPTTHRLPPTRPPPHTGPHTPDPPHTHRPPIHPHHVRRAVAVSQPKVNRSRTCNHLKYGQQICVSADAEVSTGRTCRSICKSDLPVYLFPVERGEN